MQTDHPNPSSSTPDAKPAPTASKLHLSLSRGPLRRPQKAVIYGPEGVGKSTLASRLPEPVFLDIEGGTHHLDVNRIDAADSWDTVTATIAQLARAEHPFRTLVIDTADWAEKRLAEHLCRKAGKESIEDFGYGKGHVLLAEEFARFLASLESLLRRGMHVVFLAHSTVRKFESPEQAGSYDRYELKLAKQVAPLLKEWADAILFANFVTRLAEKDNGKMRGVGGKERALFATHAAAHDAKNRHGLPDKLPFEVEALEPVFGISKSTAPASPQPPVEEPSLERRLLEHIQPAELPDVIRFLHARGQLTMGQGLRDLSPEYAQRVLAEPARFLSVVRGWVSEEDSIPGIAGADAEEAASEQ